MDSDVKSKVAWSCSDREHSFIPLSLCSIISKRDNETSQD